MAKPPPYPPKKNLEKMVRKARSKKVDPMDYVRPKPKKRIGKATMPKKMGY